MCEQLTQGRCLAVKPAASQSSTQCANITSPSHTQTTDLAYTIFISSKVNIVKLVEILFSPFLSVVPSVYMMTHNSNDVIASTAQAATMAITFPSLSCHEAALPFLVAFLISSLPFNVTGE